MTQETGRDKALRIWGWWVRCVQAGRQFEDLDEWAEDFDYMHRDDGGWVAMAATEALHNEFESTQKGHKPINRLHFVTLLKKIALYPRGRHVPVTLTEGGERAKVQRPFLVFRSPAWYQDRLYTDSYHAASQEP